MNEPAPTARGVVLVTGGNGTLGSAISAAAAQDGWQVGIGCRANDARAQAVLTAIGGTGSGCIATGNVTNAADVAAMVAKTEAELGEITAIVCAAGIAAKPQRWGKTPWDDFDAQWQVQVRGAWNVIQAVLPAMIARKRGVIVLVASTYARPLPPSFLAPYVTAKHALLGLGRALAVEMAPKGIAVHVASPSLTRSPMTAALPESALEAAAAAAPAGRLATPEATGLAVSLLLRLNDPIYSGTELRAGGG